MPAPSSSIERNRCNCTALRKASRRLSQAYDAALAPTIFILANILPLFSVKSPLENRSKLTAWWGRVQEHPSTRKTLGEQQAAMAAMMKQ